VDGIYLIQVGGKWRAVWKAVMHLRSQQEKRNFLTTQLTRQSDYQLKYNLDKDVGIRRYRTSLMQDCTLLESYKASPTCSSVSSVKMKTLEGRKQVASNKDCGLMWF
jgi:hypothetical protein